MVELTGFGYRLYELYESTKNADLFVEQAQSKYKLTFNEALYSWECMDAAIDMYSSVKKASDKTPIHNKQKSNV